MIIPLRLVHVIFRLDFLDPNLHALLPKTDILLLHLLRCLICNICDYRVDGIAYEGCESQGYEEDDEGDKLR